MKYRKLKKYKYQILTNEIFKLDFKTDKIIKTDFIELYDDTLKVKKRYCYDGPSGPTIDTKSSMVPSLMHDAMYQLIRLQLLSVDFKDEIDKEFYILCLENGMPKWRAWLWYQAVSKFGKNCLHIGEPQDEVYEV